jgi:ATP-dependent RNA helicase DeaD
MQGGTAPEKAPASAAAPTAPEWAQRKAAAAPGAHPAEVDADTTDADDAAAEPAGEAPSRKIKYERPPRTGREPGFTTLFLNVGRKQLVAPADIVGKIAGVTRLPAEVVGAIDIHQRHTLVDVAESEAELILKKLAGIRLKGVALAPTRAGAPGAET